MVWGMQISWMTLLAATAAHKAPTMVGDPLAFYGVAATVIPVLLLALIYQTRVLEQLAADDPRTKLINGPWYFALAILGEAAAFHVLATRHPTQQAQALVTVSVISLFMWLIGAHILDSMLDIVQDNNFLKMSVVGTTLIAALAVGLPAVALMWGVEIV